MDAPPEDVPTPRPSPSPAHGATTAPRLWLQILALVMLTLLAYLPVWRAGFVWDDDDHVTANAALTAAHGLTYIWSSPAIARYFPLTLTTYWAERHLWGLHPLPYHLVNLLFHAANAVLVLLLLRRLRLRAAWFAAALWAVHPVNVESVAWISQLKNVQSGFFFFSSLMFYTMFDEEKHRPLRWYSSYLSSSWYSLAFVCAVLAMLSNAYAAILAIVLLLPVWWRRGYPEKADITRIFPFVAISWLAAGFAIFTRRAQTNTPDALAARLGLLERFIVAGKAFWFYLAKILCPLPLSFVYPRWHNHPLNPLSWLPLAALLALFLLLWRSRNRPGCRNALFALAFFFAALLPVLGLVHISNFQYAFAADRFQYFASLAIITLLCSGAATLLHRAASQPRYFAALAVPLLLTASAALTWRHASVFRDEETLWLDTIAKNPQSAFAHYSLGNLLLQAGKLNAAAVHYKIALTIRPNYADAHANLGSVFLEQKRFSDAIAHYQEAARLEPPSAALECNLGIALEQTGRADEAIAHYQKVLQLDPDFIQAHNNLGNLYLQQGRFRDGVRQYQLAVDAAPRFAQLHYNLANALLDTGQIQDAIAQYQLALRLKPGYAQAHCDLGDALAQAGQLDDAITHYREALRLKPDFAAAHFGLANALSQTGRTEEAYVHYEQAQWIESALVASPATTIRLPTAD